MKGKIDEVSLYQLVEDNQDLRHDISNLGVASLQMLCIEKLYKQRKHQES